MALRLHVGNLTHGFTDDMLNFVFRAYGQVKSAEAVLDGGTGRSTGVAYVEMSEDAEAMAAMKALNNTEIGGRMMTVELAA